MLMFGLFKKRTANLKNIMETHNAYGCVTRNILEEFFMFEKINHNKRIFFICAMTIYATKHFLPKTKKGIFDEYLKNVITQQLFEDLITDDYERIRGLIFKLVHSIENENGSVKGEICFFDLIIAPDFAQLKDLNIHEVAEIHLKHAFEGLSNK